MGERQNIMQRKYKYNSERKRKRCWHGSIPKNSKDYVCVHFRGAFEWNKSLINVAKCYADCITKCVAAYGIVCFSFFAWIYQFHSFKELKIFSCEIQYYSLSFASFDSNRISFCHVTSMYCSCVY